MKSNIVQVRRLFSSSTGSTIATTSTGNSAGKGTKIPIGQQQQVDNEKRIVKGLYKQMIRLCTIIEKQEQQISNSVFDVLETKKKISNSTTSTSTRLKNDFIRIPCNTMYLFASPGIVQPAYKMNGYIMKVMFSFQNDNTTILKYDTNSSIAYDEQYNKRIDRVLQLLPELTTITPYGVIIIPFDTITDIKNSIRGIYRLNTIPDYTIRTNSTTGITSTCSTTDNNNSIDPVVLKKRKQYAFEVIRYLNEMYVANIIPIFDEVQHRLIDYKKMVVAVQAVQSERETEEKDSTSKKSNTTKVAYQQQQQQHSPQLPNHYKIGQVVRHINNDWRGGIIVGWTINDPITTTTSKKTNTNDDDDTSSKKQRLTSLTTKQYNSNTDETTTSSSSIDNNQEQNDDFFNNKTNNTTMNFNDFVTNLLNDTQRGQEQEQFYSISYSILVHERYENKYNLINNLVPAHEIVLEDNYYLHRMVRLHESSSIISYNNQYNDNRYAPSLMSQYLYCIDTLDNDDSDTTMAAAATTTTTTTTKKEERIETIQLMSSIQDGFDKLLSAIEYCIQVHAPSITEQQLRQQEEEENFKQTNYSSDNKNNNNKGRTNLVDDLLRSVQSLKSQQFHIQEVTIDRYIPSNQITTVMTTIQQLMIVYNMIHSIYSMHQVRKRLNHFLLNHCSDCNGDTDNYNDNGSDNDSSSSSSYPKYIVGDIIRHQESNVRGVICGWDYTFKASRTRTDIDDDNDNDTTEETTTKTRTTTPTIYYSIIPETSDFDFDFNTVSYNKMDANDIDDDDTLVPISANEEYIELCPSNLHDSMTSVNDKLEKLGWVYDEYLMTYIAPKPTQYEFCVNYLKTINKSSSSLSSLSQLQNEDYNNSTTGSTTRTVDTDYNDEIVTERHLDSIMDVINKWMNTANVVSNYHSTNSDRTTDTIGGTSNTNIVNDNKNRSNKYDIESDIIQQLNNHTCTVSNLYKLLQNNVGNHKEADHVIALIRMMQCNHTDPTIQHLESKGMHDIATDNLDSAIQTFVTILDQYNNDPTYNKNVSSCSISDIWIKLGICQMDGNNYNRAKNSFQKAIEHDPNNDLSWTLLGVVYNELLDYDSSIKSYYNALDINPWSEKAVQNLCTVFEEQQTTTTTTTKNE